MFVCNYNVLKTKYLKENKKRKNIKNNRSFDHYL